MRPAAARPLAALLLGVALGAAAQDQPDLRSTYSVRGDAIEAPLTDRPGDAARGRRIVADRQLGLCLLCHSGPFAETRLQGNLAGDLAGAGARWRAGQLRLRLVDPQRLNPDSIMPGYYRNHDLQRVGAAWRGKPLLQAQQIEDVVAFLSSLR